jgi:hypothetical protein
VPEIKPCADQLGTTVVAVGDPVARALFTQDAAVGDWFDQHGAGFAVVRPDRHVHGTTASADEAMVMLLTACGYFPRAQ